MLASPPLSIFIDWSISCPSPPAPTNPITTDARTAHSQRYTVYDTSSGAAPGSSP